MKDALLLASSSGALGIDGYYYVLQVDTLRNYGHLFYPTPTPLTLYLLTAVALITGDSVLAIKIAGVALHALLCLGLYALVTSVTRRRWLGVFGATLAAFSGLHTYLIVEFINSLGALALSVWCAWGAVRAIQTRKPKWMALSALLAVAALLSHRLIAALALLIVVLALLGRGLLTAGEYRKRNRYAALAALLIIFCAPAALAAQPFLALPEWLRGEFLVLPQWPLRRFDAAEGLMLLFASAGILILVARAPESPRGDIARPFFVTVALWSLLISLNPFLNHNTGFQGTVGRLSSLFHIQAAILLPGVVWLLEVGYSRVRPLVITLSFLLLALSLAAPLPYAATAGYLADRETLVRQLRAKHLPLCQDPLIIAPHGEQFVVTAVLGTPAQQRPPSGARAGCTYWLLHRVPRSASLNEQTILYDEEGGSVSALVRDEELRQLLYKTTGEERRRLLESNPHLRNALRSGPGRG